MEGRVNMKDLESIEKKEETPKAKNAPKRKRISAAERARLRAEEIRAEQAAQKALQPGDVIGGDPALYVYYHVAAGLASTGRTVAYLRSLGYELCEDGEQMVGIAGGSLYRCPKEIADERAEQKRNRPKNRRRF